MAKSKTRRRKSPEPSEFRFRGLDSIGANDAEEDLDFLRDCFVDNGDLTVLCDPSNTRRLIVGRTGVGKTALLTQIRNSKERVVEIDPQVLSLSYIAGSTILTFLDSLGVKLDIFFRMLWRHIFTVEFFQQKYGIRGQRSQTQKVIDVFRGNKHKQAVKYLEEWGHTFWEETDYRVKEITTQLETKIDDSLKLASFPVAIATFGNERQFTEEQKAEIVNRAQNVVNQVQLRQLSDIISLTDEVLNNTQQVFIITIDDLDKDWVSDDILYKLIRALIETVKDFRKVRNAKIIIALRQDLLDRVFKFTRDAGFQEEKYESLYHRILWSKSQLTEMLDNRIDKLIRQRYTKRKVTHADILPERIGRVKSLDYLLDRTLMRPRDLIQFFNLCIKHAAEKPTVSVKALREAEGEYSRLRLISIADEWSSDFPCFLEFVALIKRRFAHFTCRDITDDSISDICCKVVETRINVNCPLRELSEQVIGGKPPYIEARAQIVSVFYRMGLVGLKTDKKQGVSWSHFDRLTVSKSEISDDTSVYIHPMFYRVLGTIMS